MKKVLFFAFSVIYLTSCCNCAKNKAAVEKYFESIRDNAAELTAFCAQMPKGGDLHHHFSGSVYAETYISYVVAQNYFIDTINLRVDTFKRNVNCLQFSQLKGIVRYPKDTINYLSVFTQKLMQKWSVKDYNGVSYPSDKQFFETFSGFGIANNRLSRLEAGLLELKQRAIAENVSYIETMFTGIPADSIGSLDTNYNKKLSEAVRNHDTDLALATLDKMYTGISEVRRKQCADSFNRYLTDMHSRLKLDDSNFTMRYQNYVARVSKPVDVFKNLIVCFESANSCSLIVGVNIVAPEDNETSMRDYWLHMLMFKYCHTKYKDVKYAMHAGELAQGMVKPEERTWHINAAVRSAGANRIGHGVDMPHEYNSYDLLRYMAKNNVAIEINLYSNEFILKVKEGQHPISLYRDFKVPIVICTDDAGVLRSDMTHQYILLAQRYKNISYAEMKQYVFNSIEYSFVEEPAVKQKLKADLTVRFDRFENMIAAMHPGK